MEINHNLLMDFQEVCKQLPNIKPRTVTTIINMLRNELASQVDVFDDNVGKPSPSFTYYGVAVTFDDIGAMRVEPMGYGRIKTSPRGAELLVELYEAGALFSASEKNPKVESVPQSLKDYISMHDTLKEKTQQANAAANEEDRVYKEMVASPALVAPQDFSYKLLNDIFFEHLGPCSTMQTLTVGGIQVTKHVMAHKSNSGRNRDFAVKFEYTDKDGLPCSISKESRYRDNRRNDIERNYGLSNARRDQ